MNSDHSVSQYIAGLRQGDEEAARRIWERFLKRLTALADRKLQASPRKAMNEEDVVQQAFAEFFLHVQHGRFPKLDDRRDLWHVLAMLVSRRAKDQIKRQNTKKSGGARVGTESVLMPPGDAADRGGIARVPDEAPAPEVRAEFMELLDERLAMLPGDEHREVVVLRMQGFTNREIAGQLHSSERTVERTLQRIRAIWNNDDKHERGSGKIGSGQ